VGRDGRKDRGETYQIVPVDFPILAHIRGFILTPGVCFFFWAKKNT
jgi:hypothetical protein